MSVSTADPGQRPVWGLIAFFVGVAALVAVTLHVSGVFVEPEKSAGAAIGEIAAEIRESARRALAGEEALTPPPADTAWKIDDILVLAVPILAGIAAVLGAVSLFLREAPTLPAIAITMGVGAFVMQFVFWLALVIGGICLLIAIVNNIEGILGG